MTGAGAADAETGAATRPQPATGTVAGERFRPYRSMLAAQMRAQRSYRASFAIEVAGATLFTALDLLTVLVIFRVTRTLGGFPFRVVFLMSTTSGLAFACADLVAGNIDRLRTSIRTGQLDTAFVRPLGILSQLIATDFELRRAGRVVEGVVALGIACGLAHVRWSASAVLLLTLTLLAAAVFFFALFVAGATVTFWWIDSGEFANGFTYGGRDFTTYPVNVYGSLFRRLFAFGLGFAAVAYYPTLTLLHLPDPLGLPSWTGWLSPAVAAVAATVAAAAWRSGVRHYRSTGS